MSKERSLREITRRKILVAGSSGLAAGLAGCAGGDGDSTPTSGGDATDTPAASDGEDGTDGGNNIELDAWAWSVHGPPLEELANRYDDASVAVENLPQQAGDERLLTALQAQTDLPSITLIRGQILKEVARNGGMLKLTDLMEENEDKLFPAAKTLNPVDGTWFSIPNDLGPYALMYNVDMFEEAGLPTEREAIEEEIQTWDDFITIGEQFKEDTGNDFITFQQGSTANGLANAMKVQAGGNWYNEDGEFQFDQEPNVRALSKLQEMNDRINLAQDQWTGKYWDSFRNEDVAVLAGAAWMVGFIKQEMADMEGKWRVMLMPRLGEDTPRASNYGGAGAGIPLALGSEEQEAAKEFGKYWHLSEESFNVKLEMGVFPAHYIEGAEQETATDPYFGGQQRNKVFIESAKNCPPQYQRPNDRVQELAREANRLILQEDRDVEEVLQQKHEEMAAAVPEKDMTLGGTTG